MKDAILKGTGDSRYLKSKIPTGTTWEQALAMLNAGTFPVDLNGINSEGFQQLGTPLNKANLLKDAVSSKLGLVGDKTPNDMFGVLADCGNLHVWRKTVVTIEEVPAVPAGYTLGEMETDILVYEVYRSYAQVQVDYSAGTGVSVAMDGTPSVTGASSAYFRTDVNDFTSAASTWATNCRGKYVKFTSDFTYTISICSDILLIPSDATISRVYVNPTAANATATFVVSKAQRVIPYPYTPAIPAGTTTTYPVSTNRNAYQEGNNAKPAGYVLGDVVTASTTIFSSSYGSGVPVDVTVADSVDVAEDGTVSMPSTATTTRVSSSPGTNKDTLLSFAKGKIVKFTSNDSYVTIKKEGPFFVPTDATFSGEYQIAVDKYQPVTGYPVIGGTIVDYVEKRTEETDGRIMASDYESSSYACVFEAADSIEIGDDGSISLVSPSDVSVYFNSTVLYYFNSLKGKYIRLKSTPSNTSSYFPGHSGTTQLVGFVASDAEISTVRTNNVTTATITSGAYLISSTPVVYGETMEYLGCLGDKTRVNVLHYVGTGTYGSSSPNSISIPSSTKLLYLLTPYTQYVYSGETYTTYAGFVFLPMVYVTSAYKEYSTTALEQDDQRLSFKLEGDMLYWYTTESATKYGSRKQFNLIGVEYTVIAIG